MESKQTIQGFYQGKSIFLTGITGFIGKVILERLLRSLPDINKIYVLIRNKQIILKQGSSALERLKKDIINSQCFDQLRFSNNRFSQHFFEKVIPIPGDLTYQNLGLSAEDEQTIIENVNVMISCAASVDFNLPLDQAFDINVKGPLKLLELAKKVKNLNTFIHVSTCYVNSEKKGVVDEKIYDFHTDPQKLMDHLLSLPSEKLKQEEKKVLGEFPNTYTFTKSVAERLIQSNRGDLPVVIVRPSIVGCSLRDPLRGWIDSVSAVGAILLFIGLGIIKTLEGDPECIGDVIPADYVCDYCIVAAYTYADRKELNVIHCGSSEQNAVTWDFCAQTIVNFFKLNPSEKAAGDVSLKFINNKWYLTAKQLERRIPAAALTRFANFTKVESLKKKSTKMNKVLSRADFLEETFTFFIKNEWKFKQNKVTELIESLNENDRKVFQLDVKQINWHTYFNYFGYGLRHFILKEPTESPVEPGNLDILRRKPKIPYFQDIYFVISKGKHFETKSIAEIKADVLRSERVQSVLKKFIAQRLNKLPNNKQSDYQQQNKIMKQVNAEADQICGFIFSTYNTTILRGFAFILQKLFNSIYEKVVIDSKILLNQLRDHNTKQYGPVIFIPTHKSYIDFLIVSFIMFAYKVQCPHIASAEDFINIIFVNKMLRASGSFFIKRQRFETDELYRAILYEYVQVLLIEDSFLEFFVEGTRSRSGKLLSPKYGLLTIVADTYFDKKLPDIQMIPITINYEKVLEGNTFPMELLGEEKVKESLSRIIKAIKILNENFGRMEVKLCEPISLKQYALNFQKTTKNPDFDPFGNMPQRKQVIKQLGQDIVCTLSDNLIIMSTSIVASILLMHRKGISEEMLVDRVEWLSRELKARNAETGGVSPEAAAISVKNAVNLLDTIVNRKKDIFELSITPKYDYKNILLLSYYRNNLMHVFFLESVIACALASFGQQLAWKEGVQLERLYIESVFLFKMLKNEFVVREGLKNINDFQKVLNIMVTRNILHIEDDKIKVADITGDLGINYLCSLLWPFIDTYWVSLVFLLQLKRSKQNLTKKKLLEQVALYFWFAETLYEEKVLDHFESCSLDTLKNSFALCQELNLINIDNVVNTKTNQTDSVVRILASEEELKKIEEHVSSLQKGAFIKTVNSPIDVARRSMAIEFPLVSKL